MEENGIKNRKKKQSPLFLSYFKIPSWPKIPSFVDTPKYLAWKKSFALGHGIAWDHYKMENVLQKY